MRLISVALIVAAGLAVTAPRAAAADTVVPLPRFKSIELNGGGRVVLRHGPAQRVRLLKGSLEHTSFEVTGGTTRRVGKDTFVNNRDQLVIDVCGRKSCNGRYDLEVEIVTPDIAAIAVNGGGHIESSGPFPAQDSIGVAIKGGGVIDARALPAENVGAAISGGGRILTHATASLGAAINGGGEIRYWGDPAISTAINGGGRVTRGK